MAERRMFHTAVVESDAFLDMTPAAQALYFHLGMTADDDGFINGPRQVCRTLGAPMECLQELIDGNFLLWFDGVAVVRHWRMSNNLKADRLKMPRYPDIAKNLFFGPNKIYQTTRTRGTESLWNDRAFKMKSRGIQLDPNGIQLESQKRRKEKKREENKREEKKIKENKSEEKKVEENVILSVAKDPPRRAFRTNEGDSSGSLCPQNDSRDEGAVLPDYRTDDYLCGEDLPKKKILQLTVEQLHMLYERMGFTAAVRYMDKLSNFIQTHGANIKDHYATIIKWWEEDGGIYL